MGALLRRLIAILILGYVLTAAYYWHYQRWYLFWPEKEIEATPRDFKLTYEDVWLEAKSARPGEPGRIHGWWIPGREANSPALLYLHGGGRNISKEAVHASHFWDMGFSVLIVDYRGSGRSEGELPSEAMMYEDATLAWDYLRRMQPDPRRRYLYGHSLGAAVAVDLAVRVQVAAGLILESGFTSTSDLLRTSAFFRLFPLDLLVNQRFDSTARIGSIRMPVLLLHGREDGIVPATMSERLYALAPQPKTLVLISGGGHSDSMRVGREEYWSAVKRFVGEASGG